VTVATGALAAGAWELAVVAAGVDGAGDAVEPQALASTKLTIANPTILVRIDVLLQISCLALPDG
jgi:hypothetical protein